MKIDTYIHELLLENETVIIPGFGAFISHYKPAEIREENDEIIPPGKTLSFNQKIRNNDALLVGYVAEKENISHFDALKRIEKERENIIYQLDKGEKITFKNIGILYRNQDNEMEFDPFQQENLLLDSFGLEATTINPSELEVEEENNGQPKPEIEIETEKTELIDTSKENIELEEKSEEKAEEPHETNQEPVTFVKDEIVFSETGHVFPEKEKNKKKKRMWIWLLLILIPLIAAGIYLYTNQNKEVPEINITEVKPSTEDNIGNQEGMIPADTIKSDSSIVETTGIIQSETTKNDSLGTTEIMDKNGIFYLVAGSFKEKENAEKFIEEFNADGYTPINLGKKGNFYIVAIGSFNTEKEAFKAQKQFMGKNPDSGTWVYKDETR